MSAFQNDIFNRRASSAFLSDFRQDNRSGMFAAPVMPKPMFSDNGYGAPPMRSQQQHHRSSSYSAPHKHFAYVAGCEICEDYIRCGKDICHHEHRIVCRGISHGCCCHHCCERREVTVCNSSASSRQQSSSAATRTEEAVTDSKFGDSRVRTRSATTMVGDGASFGFANMDAEMLRVASDNRWRSSNSNDSFYAKPFNHCAPAAPPQGHVQLREGNVAHAFEAHGQMHGCKQAEMRSDAAAHFAGYNRPMPLFSANYGASCEEESEKVKITTTTTTTTRTMKQCKSDETPCHTVRPPSPPHPPPAHHHHHEEHSHHHHHHQGGTVIPIGTKPDIPVRPAEPCCTWCKFLPCLSCPHPTNPNARFKKANFRLYPEYEFLPDDVEVPKPTDYFPQHTHVASRSQFKVTVPKANQIAQRIYVDFIGDQMVVIGEHGKPIPGANHPHTAAHLTRSSTRSSLGSKETAHLKHFVPGHDQTHMLGVSKVFAKNFFVPRDTYDRDRAQAFIKPNGNLKIVVPVLES
ncbi:hypothetical protein IW140_006125 [Coemansia sp. RSA 1813]|nr:hypothetical protein EV178_006136 [Coemansia sp. RSA 1646]KAJ1766802.1 hypothetical protein LPJ74_005708 [Coemansia sp. RSA 1843]KAJ2085806.1 hypothetical protein IW138_006094 [Coemansia sp. RSA 986]KAJ2212808.1 hypothetical protein EV179_004375 [Coemansia sp. RSA 487]KAJ2563388.1 hypothetical protein IW140_006125 [Coemansia sp. RSA 1813]